MIFRACFMLRGRDTHWFFAVIVSDRHGLPSDARAFSLTFSDTQSSSFRLNKGYRLLNFPQIPSLI